MPNMTPEQERVERLAELELHLVDSDAWKLRSRLMAFDTSREIFRRNFGAVHRAIVAHKPVTRESAIRIHESHRLRDEQQLEILRHFHNFVASASSLVDHSRNFYRELYEPGGFIPEYQARVDSDFVGDGISQFVVQMRNAFLHGEAPLIGTHSSFGANDSLLSSVVYLDKADLLGRSFSGAAKKYLVGCRDRINLEQVVAAYYEKVVSFHGWFKSEQTQVHKKELDYIESVFVEIRKLGGGGLAELQPASADEHPFSDKQIELIAYYIAHVEGWSDGRDKLHWSMAIERLKELRDRTGAEIV